jgi:hypothetical protein
MLLAVPFLSNVVMFAAKWLAGLNLTNNDSSQTTYLRALLVLVSLCGVVATSLLSGTQLDISVVTQDVTLLIQTGVLAFLGHAVYTAIFRS